MPPGCSCDLNQSKLPTPVPLDITAPPTGDSHVVVPVAQAVLVGVATVTAHNEPPDTEASVNSPPLYLVSCTFLI